jgi:hypothetical protein
VGAYGFAVKYTSNISDWGQPILVTEGAGNVVYPASTITFPQPLLAPNLVYTTGNQSISGNKIFGTDNVSLSTLNHAAILGGCRNLISGTIDDSFIANGCCNIITGEVSDSFILNGASNAISSQRLFPSYSPDLSYIANGCLNQLSGCVPQSTVLNGCRNVIDSSLLVQSCNNTIINGFSNRINDSLRSIIGNGAINRIDRGSYLEIGNGVLNNICVSQYSTIGNGASNLLCVATTYSNILNGTSNTVDCCSSYSTIIGGSNNRTQGCFNLIGGGSFNVITGSIANSCAGCSPTLGISNVIAGGANNSIKSSSCSAILGGRYNEVNHNGATIIGDGSLNIKTSRGACTLLMSFENGIYLDAPIVEVNNKAIYVQKDVQYFTGNNFTPNANEARVFEYVLTGIGGATATLNAPTNLFDGDNILIKIQQSPSGSNNLVFDSSYKFPGGVVPSLTLEGSRVDIYTILKIGSNFYSTYVKDFTS